MLNLYPVLIVALQVSSAAGLAWLALRYMSGLQNRLWWFSAFGTGALLANVLFHLLPEAWDSLAPAAFWSYFGCGIAFGLAIQLALHSRKHISAIASLQLGDAACNFVDGVLIASATLIDPWLGVVTALVVTLHELPSELGEMGLLVANGLSGGRALITNLSFSGSAAILGAIVTSLAGHGIGWSAPLLTAAGSGLLLQVLSMQILPRIVKAPHVIQTVGRLAAIGGFLTLSMTLVSVTEHLTH